MLPSSLKYRDGSAHMQVNKCNNLCNGLNDKVYITISIDAEKGFEKIQHVLIIKVLGKVELGEQYLKIIKAI